MVVPLAVLTGTASLRTALDGFSASPVYLIVGAFILTAAFLNAGQSLTTTLLPGSYWLALLSFAFRISLIPGFAYLTYRAVSRLHDRCGEKRLVVILSSLMLLTVFVLMPARPQARLASPEAALKSQRLREVIYRADDREKHAPVKTPLQRPSNLNIKGDQTPEVLHVCSLH